MKRLFEKIAPILGELPEGTPIVIADNLKDEDVQYISKDGDEVDMSRLLTITNGYWVETLDQNRDYILGAYCQDATLSEEQVAYLRQEFGNKYKEAEVKRWLSLQVFTYLIVDDKVAIVSGIALFPIDANGFLMTKGGRISVMESPTELLFDYSLPVQLHENFTKSCLSLFAQVNDGNIPSEVKKTEDGVEYTVLV